MGDEGVEMVSVPRAEWESMKAQVAQLLMQRERSADTVHRRHQAVVEPRTDRRDLLKRGAAIAVGVVAGGATMAVATADPAAAAGTPVLLGADNNSGPNTTTLESGATQTLTLANAGTGTALYLLNSGMVANSMNGTTGVSSHSSGDDGVLGYSSASAKAGVHGQSVSGPAVFADGTLAISNSSPALQATTQWAGPAVAADVVNPTNAAPAVDAQTSGVGPAVSGVITNSASTASAVSGTTNGTGIALYGEIDNPASDADAVGGVTNGTGAGFGGLSSGSGPAVEGVTVGTGPAVAATVKGATKTQAAVSATTHGTGAAVQGTGSGAGSRGGLFAGTAAQVQLTPGSASGPPASGQTGDLYVDSTGRLWFCKAGGTTATWAQIA